MVENGGWVEFSAAIVQSDERGAGAFVLVPASVVEALGGGGRIPVECSFDGEPYRGSVVNMGAGPCIGVLKSIREKLKKGRGDALNVCIRRDERERTVDTPLELADALAKDAPAKAHFDALSYSRKREYCQWVSQAKREETRKKRADEALLLLAQGKPLKT